MTMQGPQRTAPIYGTPDDLDSCGLPPRALEKIGPEERWQALYVASRTADTLLSTRFKTPLQSWGQDLVQIVCVIAGFRLICYRGWKPSDPANEGLVMMYNEALKTLKAVSEGDANLSMMETTPDPIFAPDVQSDRPRGL
jgi:phage gp36-like protein